ncbi:hypothetical protein HOY80DRAFT_82075 [Tuber brumale]|nr:hypothetical protein HOY80DRAFT_82075 [Tuber brumale]
MGERIGGVFLSCFFLYVSFSILLYSFGSGGFRRWSVLVFSFIFYPALLSCIPISEAGLSCLFLLSISFAFIALWKFSSLIGGFGSHRFMHSLDAPSFSSCLLEFVSYQYLLLYALVCSGLSFDDLFILTLGESSLSFFLSFSHFFTSAYGLAMHGTALPVRDAMASRVRAQRESIRLGFCK